MNTSFNLSWWQTGIASVAISALGGLSSMESKEKDRKVYTKKLRQAPWAPPPWLFAPAWTINNFFLLQGLQKIVSSQPMTERKRLLFLQAPIWFIFFSFGYIYFKKKSPVLAALWTVSDAVLAASSFKIARKVDKNLSFKYLPLLTWTTFASSLALYQAIKNQDPVLENVK